MAALRFIEVPGYSALILRKTYADLSLPGAIMDRAKSWLIGRPGVEWSEQSKTFRFASGATIQFGYADNTADHYRYQGAEFQTVCFDELTQFGEEPYRYLFSRLRRLKGSRVPLRMRAASNPGGIGHEWVKARFLDGNSPDRVFVPARLTDNPFLDRAEYERSLAQLTPVERARLQNGDWNASYEGGCFKKAWFRYWVPEEGGALIRVGDRVHKLSDCRRFATVDLAVSVKTSADWTVAIAWAVTPDSDLVLLDLVRDRIEAPRLYPVLSALTLKHDLAYVAVEAVGTQLAIVQDLRFKGLTVRGLKAEADKITRAQTAIVRTEAGQVFFLAKAPWLETFEHELLSFPQEEVHDDQVDAFAYGALEVFRYGPAAEPADIVAERVRLAEEEARREWGRIDNPAWWS